MLAATLDTGAVSFASSGASARDGDGRRLWGGWPGTTSYALSVTNAASGLTVTDGSAITLSLVGGQVVGTVGAERPIA